MERGQLAGNPSGKENRCYACNRVRELESGALCDLDSLLFGHEIISGENKVSE